MNKKNKGGRPEKSQTEKATTALYLRMTVDELTKLSEIMKESEIKNKTRFVKDKLFKSSENIALMNDKNIKNIYLNLIKYIQEYHAIGVNFNQLVRKVNGLSETSGIRYDLKYELNFTANLFEKLIEQQENILEITTQFYKEWSAK